MTLVRTLKCAALAAAGLAAAVPTTASAQSLTTNPAVEISNTGNETRKVCFHKPKRVTLLAIGCVTLSPGERIFWDRKGVFTPFKVKVYKKRKLVDKYLYSRDLPMDTGKVLVGAGGRFGFSRFKNITKQFKIRVCNSNYDDPVYLVLGYDTPYGMMSHGWWGLERGQCRTLPVTKNLKSNWNIPSSQAPRIYFYARTYGDEPLYWHGRNDNRARSFCMNPGKRFKAKLDASSACTGELREKSFRFFEAPTQQSNETLRLEF